MKRSSPDLHTRDLHVHRSDFTHSTLVITYFTLTVEQWFLVLFSDRLTYLIANRTLPLKEENVKTASFAWALTFSLATIFITLLWHGTANIMFLVYDIVLIPILYRITPQEVIFVTAILPHLSLLDLSLPPPTIDIIYLSRPCIIVDRITSAGLY